MKRLAALAALIFATAASAAIPPPVVTEQLAPAVWTLYKGSTKQPNTFPSLEVCQSVMRGLEGSLTTATATFECRASLKVVVTLSPGSPAPVNEFQMLSCPSGAVSGAQWQQTRDYRTKTTPPFWTVTAWTPTKPQKGACPPAPPQPAMHAGLEVSDADMAWLNTFAMPGVTDVRIAEARELPPNAVDTPAFRTVCDFAGANRNDPIVYPGMPDHAHPHIWFNNAAAMDANATLASLTAGDARCRGGAMNKSGLWAPPLLEWDPIKLKWTPWRPKGIIVYYKIAPWTFKEYVQPIPRGIKMIAGDPLGSEGVRFGNVGWSCNGNAQARDDEEPWNGGSHKIPKCAVGQEVWASISFPPCWDGVNKDSADHKSHVAFPPSPWPADILPSGCPPSHPVLMPQVTFQVMWKVDHDYDPMAMAVASDVYKKDKQTTVPGGYGMHGDYFADWPGPPDAPEDFQMVWLVNCLRAGKDCAAHMLGDGRTLGSFGNN